MKPVGLVERAIRNSSKTRDIVLDPFGGSGSILIACEKTGRQARLVELDPRYCDDYAATASRSAAMSS
jgi:DNA modification methylase